ncbi:MAG TPA: DUF4386 domain-containing protein [Anaerolineae bacterium]|nr:DUF4386 domain-containing protein [Anaerolineae bacterium]
MKTHRVNAVIVGVLFIVATAAGSIAAAIGSPIMDAPDYLSKIAAHEGTVLTGAFLTFLMSVACAGVGLGLYPIMRKYSVGLAIGAAGFRLIESMTEILTGISIISLLALSREYVAAGAPTAAYFQTFGAIIRTADEWVSNGVTLISWCIGAFMYYGVFYRYRLVPRWLSVWGLIGITLTIITSTLVMLDVIPGFGTVQMIANGPIALQEMVFAVWLIAKGVDTTAVAVE